MLNITSRLPFSAAILWVCAALSACAPKTDVSATGSVPAHYTHFFLTANAIWLNTSSTAGPDDSTWANYTLARPVTVDLGAASAGTLRSLTTGLTIPVGTYAQMRLIPVDSGVALQSSASAIGAVYNTEVDYLDSAGAVHRAPLELQNPDKGIGIQTTLRIKGNTSELLASNSTSAGSSTSSSTTSAELATGLVNDMNAGNPTGMNSSSPATTTTPATTAETTTVATTDSSNTTTGSGSSATPVTIAINIDGTRDLVPFTYGGTNGVLLNPHATAYDSATVGAIQGSVKLAGLANVSLGSSSAFANIQVTAETLSADGSRHIAVNSTPVRTDGTFTLYPLATGSTAANYDLVVHGPAISTIIIKSVPVIAGDPSTTPPTSVGTISPRSATSFAVNVETSTALPAGAQAGFYQTLPQSGEVPYLIEAWPVDPFSRNFPANQALSAGTVDHGTFAATGATVSLATVTPAEGSRGYRALATAPLFADGVLSASFAGPQSGNSVLLVGFPALSVASGAVATTVTFSVTQAFPGRYDQGELIISHDGAIVATATLNTLLARGSGASIAVAGIPGSNGFASLDSALYYVSVRVWNSSNPAGTLNRETYPTALDLRAGRQSSYALNID